MSKTLQSASGRVYYPTIGLEIHAELATHSKMFCPCKNDPDEATPNKNVCPICMGHPGTLPVPNKQAIEHVIRMGLAVGANIADFSEFDRKNYFYPDIPKGYQISQYKYPIVSGGELAGIKITRVHLEEDTATSKHVTGTIDADKDGTLDNPGGYSLVDYNRSSVPLMELVTEPVINSAEDAMKFAKELQLLLRYLGASHANMEKGEMRVEANISVSEDPNAFGTKVEVKNLNSFSVVGKAIEYELKRMIDLIEAGKKDEIVQETRGWDDAKQATFSQRKKENAHDYRYFPEPDIPKMKLHEAFDLDAMKKELPELPWEKRARYKEMYGLKDEDIESYVVDDTLASFFENVVILLSGDAKKVTLASNYVTSDLLGIEKNWDKQTAFNYPVPEQFAKLITMAADGVIGSRATKDILVMLVETGGDPEEIAKREGLLQQSDAGALEPIAREIIAANPKVVEDYKSGKEALLQFFVGQGMKATKGAGNPTVLAELFKKILAE